MTREYNYICQMLQGVYRKSSSLFGMDANTAKRLVLTQAERQKLNYSWIAEQLGRTRQQIRQWVTLENAPSDPNVWVQMATLLGLNIVGASSIAEVARELALEVLVKSDDHDLKTKAAMLIRELSRTYDKN